MKTLFVLLTLVSFKAFAFEIDVANAPVPAAVVEAIRERLTTECGSVARSIKSIVLEKYDVKRIRIDQGYLDDHFDFNFVINFDGWTSRNPDRLLIKVTLPIEERSGRYDPYVTDFQTVYGSDGDAICNN